MPDSWKRNSSINSDDGNESGLSAEDQENIDTELVGGAALSTNKRPSIGAKLSAFKAASVHFVTSVVFPVLPTVLLGCCVYGVVIASPHALRYLSGVLISAGRAGRQLGSSLIRPTSPRVKSSSAKSKDFVESLKDAVKDATKGGSRPPSTPVSTGKVPEKKIVPPSRGEKLKNAKKGVDLESLAAAQHMNLWEITCFRLEMIKRSFY
jgi:hypothetical protein